MFIYSHCQGQYLSSLTHKDSVSDRHGLATGSHRLSYFTVIHVTKETNLQDQQKVQKYEQVKSKQIEEQEQWCVVVTRMLSC